MAPSSTFSAATGSSAQRDQPDPDSDDHHDRADDRPHRVTGHRGATHHSETLQRPDDTDHDQHGRDDQHDDLHQELLPAWSSGVATIASRPSVHTGHRPPRWCHAATDLRSEAGRLTRYRRWVTAVDSTTPDLSSSTCSPPSSGNILTPRPSRTGTRLICSSSSSPAAITCRAVSAPITSTSRAPAADTARSTASATPPVTKLNVPLGITSSSRPRWVSTKQATG